MTGPTDVPAHYTIEVPVIALVVGGHTGRLDDYKGGVRSIIRVHPDYSEKVVQGIETFSHLQVLWHFHQATDPVDLGARHPRNDTSLPEVGAFGHHNHRRPARLGLSFPKLLEVDGLDLHVEDLDADDGTPVIDFVAVFQEMLPRGPISQPAWPSDMLARYWAPASERPSQA